MPFKVEKEEYVNKTFTLVKKLIDQLKIICNEKTSH